MRLSSAWLHAVLKSVSIVRLYATMASVFWCPIRGLYGWHGCQLWAAFSSSVLCVTFCAQYYIRDLDGCSVAVMSSQATWVESSTHLGCLIWSWRLSFGFYRGDLSLLLKCRVPVYAFLSATTVQRTLLQCCRVGVNCESDKWDIYILVCSDYLHLWTWSDFVGHVNCVVLEYTYS